MSANVIGKPVRPRRPRGRAAMALLPGVFALMFAGASGVAAAGTSPSATATLTSAQAGCTYGTKPSGKCCPKSNPCLTTPSPSPTPTPTPSPTSKPIGGNPGGGGPTPTPSPAPTSTPAPTASPGPTASPAPSGSPTSTPVASSGGSGGGQSNGGASAGSTGGSQAGTSVDPAPFAPLASVVTTLTSGRGLDSARIPPVEALTPLNGLAFGNGLNLGPILLLIDVIGIGMLVYLVRTRWLTPEA